MALRLAGFPGVAKSGANTTAIHSVNQDAWLDIELRQCKYHNNLVEPDHRVVKRVMAPMPGFKLFWSARAGVPVLECQEGLRAGIETMQMVKQGQLHGPGGQVMSAADQFYRLAF